MPRLPPTVAWLATGGALVLAIFGVYAAGLGAPFIFDDIPTILTNPSIGRLWPLGDDAGRGLTAAGRPLVHASLALNHMISGVDPRGYRVVNVLLHAGAALSLLGLVRRTLLLPRMRERWGNVATPAAFAAAALWALHPLQTGAVTYIVQRAEVLAAFFALGTLYAFARAADALRPTPWRAGGIVLCLAGMLSKESVAALPVLVVLYDRAFVTGSFGAAWGARRNWFLGLAATWLPLAALVLLTRGRGETVGFDAGVSWWNYALTQAGAVVHYLRLVAWPHPLVFDYGTAVAGGVSEVWRQVVVLLALVAGTVWLAVRNHWAGFAGVWLLALLAPSSSVVPVATQTMAEHRMYLPLAAIAVPCALLLLRLGVRRGMAVALVFAAGLGVLTVRRNVDYRSALSLWADTVAKRPDNPRAHAYLGLALLEAGRGAEAVASLEASVHLQPRDWEALNNLGLARAFVGQLGEAIRCYEAALTLRPSFAKAHINLADALLEAGRVNDAIGHYEAALRLQPGDARAHHNLGSALARAGRIDEALEKLREAVRRFPDSAEAHHNLATVLLQTGRVDEAVAESAAAVHITPASATAQLGLGHALARAGRTAEALTCFEAALRLRPDDARAAANAGTALVQLGRMDEARTRFEQALHLQPDFAEAHHNLAIVLLQAGDRVGAALHLQETLRLRPDYPGARELLVRVRSTPAPASAPR
jgi:protein O-mannosyl-transferase